MYHKGANIQLTQCYLIALLSGTLRTFQVHACDGEELKLECLPNTVISIYLAQYGRNVPQHQLCPSTPPSAPASPTLSSSDHSSSSFTSHNNNDTSLFNYNDTSSDCLSSDSLRVRKKYTTISLSTPFSLIVILFLSNSIFD